MATEAEIITLRNWMMNLSAQLLAKFDDLNGEEPNQTIIAIRVQANNMHVYGLEIIKALDELLIQKSRAKLKG